MLVQSRKEHKDQWKQARGHSAYARKIIHRRKDTRCILRKDELDGIDLVQALV